MKSESVKTGNTGIIRRIDELGRIVIPKELREVFRIKVGTPMQISVEGDRLLLTKFSVLSIFEELAYSAAKSLHEITKQNILISNEEIILAVYGNNKSLFEGNKDLNKNYLKILELRKTFTAQSPEEFLKYFGLEKNLLFTIRPIRQNGDILGSLALIGEEMKQVDISLLELAATIVEKQFE